jgi:hypothetical protein
VLDLGAAASARALDEPANQLGDDGAIAIAELVATTKTLRAIDVRANAITSHGAMAIQRALAHNVSLVELGLRCLVARTIRRRIRTLLAANAARTRPASGPPHHVAMIQSVYRTLPGR